jgi:hypothetical protein
MSPMDGSDWLCSENYERGHAAFVALWIQSTGLGDELWALDLALALRDPEGHQTRY